MQDDFWAGVKRQAATRTHERALQGLKKETCGVCQGKGHNNDARDGYDEYGVVYCPATSCKDCQGQGYRLAPCDRRTQVQAIKKEIAEWQKKLRDLEPKAKRSG